MTTFNDTVLDELLTKGEYSNIASMIDASINEISDEYDSTNTQHEEIIKNAYVFNDILKGLNHNYLESLSNVVTEIKDNDNYGIDTIDKYNDLKDKSDRLKSTNENNMKYYIENYLYVIVKVLIIIVLFYLLFKVSLPNVGLLTFNIPLLFKNTGKQVNGLRKNIGKQIKEINNNIKKKKSNSEISYDKTNKKFNSMNGNTYNKSLNGFFSTPKLKNNQNKNVIDISNINSDKDGRLQRRQTMNTRTNARQQSSPISVNSNSSRTTSSTNNSPSP